jgi:CHAT domain-containing protein/tetratricopeptide (TPR) repeat protein
MHEHAHRRVALLVLATVALGAVRAGAARQSPATPLTPGVAVERPLPPAASWSGTIDLRGRSYARIVVSGRGALIRVRAVGPDGVPLFEAERRGGSRDPIVWAHVSDTDGPHAVQVESLESEDTRTVGVALTHAAPATAQDARRAEALRQLNDALRTGPVAADTAEARRDAAQRAVEALHRPDEALALATLAGIDADAGRSRDAAATLAHAVALARDAGAAPLEADLLVRLGRLQAATGQPREAEQTLTAALALHERLGDAAGQAEAYGELGAVSGMRSENPAAIDRFTRSVALARTAADRRTEAASLNMLGVVYSSIADPDRAVANYEAALSIRRRLQDDAGIGQILTNLGVILRDRGEPRAAIGNYEEALDIRRRAGNVQGIAATLHNLGVATADLGDYDRAIDIFGEAIATWRVSRGRRGEAFGLVNLGQSYAKLGAADEALRYLAESLPIWREQGDKRGEAQALLGVGAIHAARQDRARAHDAFAQALALVRETGFRRETAQALTWIADVELARGAPEAALAAADEAIAIARSIADRREEGRAGAARGRSLLRLSRTADAAGALREALTHFQHVEDRALEASVHANLAEALVAAGDDVAARGEQLAALDLLESLRGDVAPEGLRVSFFASKRAFYDDTVRMLMTLHARNPAAGYDDEALHVAERGRARALLDLLAEGRIDVGGADDADLTELRRTQELIRVKASRLTRVLNAANAGGQAATARRELDALLARYDDLHGRIRDRRPDLASLVRPEPATAQTIRRAVVPSGSVLVEFWLGERESYVWAITATRTYSAALPGRATIEAAARRAHDTLRDPARRIAGEDARALALRVERSARTFDRAAAELSRLLLEPVAPALAATRVLIVADGALQYVPFAALPAPGSAVPLVERHEVVTLPSASVAMALADRSAGRGTPSRRLLVVGDPVYGTDDVRVATAAPRNDAAFARLRFSREEALQIAALAPQSTTLALDFQATRERTLASAADGYGIVHLAAHAVVNDERPQLSGIALSMVDERGRPRDGFLRLPDVYSMPLAARLVVLSACSTALGRDTPGEGLVGLARGFLYAGADRVVATLWEVDDRASAALMGRFYGALLQRGVSATAALREAQRWMRQDPRRRHPYYWAAWVAIGA